MTVGATVAGIGIALLTRVEADGSYVADVLPGIIVFGLGLSALVAPLTAAVLESLGQKRAGLASGVNNAVARLGGLSATAVVPLAAGMGGLENLAGPALASGYGRGMWISAALCVIGGAICWFTVRGPGRPETENT